MQCSASKFQIPYIYYICQEKHASIITFIHQMSQIHYTVGTVWTVGT